MMKIQRDIQIDAIKKRECFKVTKYEGYALITDGIYGVYVNDEDLLLNPDKFNDVADKESFDRYEMEDSEGVKVLNEAITLERETANAVINYKKEFYGKMFKDSEIAFVYVYTGSVDIDKLTLQKEELDRVDWFNLEYVYEECKKHNQKFCAPIDGLEIARKYVCEYGI